MAEALIGHRATLAILGLTLAAYLALGLGYATLTPIWQNPDEPAHYNYVAFVAETGGLPVLQPGDWDSALLDRLKNSRLQPGDSVDAIRYEAWQPPLYYLAAAPFLRFGPAEDTGALVFRLRVFDVVLGALTLGLAYLVGVETLPKHLAVAVPLVMVGIPMFTSVSASISADPLANLLAAGALLMLMRWVRGGGGARSAAISHGAATPGRSFGGYWSVGAGVLLGLGLLTKLALGIFFPLALLTIALRAWRPAREAAILLCAAGLVVLPWIIHQVTSYGWADPLATSRHAAVVLDQPRFPGMSLAYLASFANISFHSFWAQFGWMGVVAPDKLYWVYGLLSLIALGGLVIERRLLGDPAMRLLLTTLGSAVVAYIAYNLTFEQPQGRYLFTALAPIAILLVLGWAGWLPRRFQAWSLLVIGMGLVALNAYALMRVLVLGFAPTG